MTPPAPALPMEPIIFKEQVSVGNEGTGGGSGDVGWRKVYQHESPDGISRTDWKSPAQSETRMVLHPRLLTKPRKFQNTTPTNLHRKIGRDSMGKEEDALPPKKHTQPYDPPSDSAREYFYAPGQGSNTPMLNVVQSGEVRADDVSTQSKEEYGVVDRNVELGEDGYNQVKKSSDFTQNPRTWRFRKKDKDVNLLLGPNHTSDPLPPERSGIGSEDLVYPLQGAPKKKSKSEDSTAKSLAKKAEGKKQEPQKRPAPKQKVDWLFGQVAVGSAGYKMGEGGKEASTRFDVPVHSPDDRETPMYVLRFFLMDAPGSRTAATIPETDLEGPRVYWYPIEPESAKLGDPTDTAEILDQFYHSDIPDKAAALLKKEYMPSGEAELRRRGLAKYGGNVFKDPALDALDPKITETERLFTTIRKWTGDTYVLSAEDLSQETRSALEKNPTGDGKYFYWYYISPEKSGKASEEEIRRKGFTVSPGEGGLMVRRKPAWKENESKVWESRKEMGWA